MEFSKNSTGKSEKTANFGVENHSGDEGISTPIETVEDLQGNIEKLKTLHYLHKKKVRKNIHKAMSPISAISGYLELMKMSLKEGGDTNQLERYRAKIDQGVSELGEIIEELHKIYNKQGGRIDNMESLISGLETRRRAS
jgi:hypothetical protein